jgi:hypothetical protein
VSSLDDWQNRARCRQEAPGTMHPDHATEQDIAEAIAVCTGCPVVEQCRAAAEDHDAYGVWAGEWWGEPPVLEVERTCAHCGVLFRDPGGRRPRRFCTHVCKVAAGVEARRQRNKMLA